MKLKGIRTAETTSVKKENVDNVSKMADLMLLLFAENSYLNTKLTELQGQKRRSIITKTGLYFCGIVVGKAVWDTIMDNRKRIKQLEETIIKMEK